MSKGDLDTVTYDRQLCVVLNEEGLQCDLLSQAKESFFSLRTLKSDVIYVRSFVHSESQITNGGCTTARWVNVYIAPNVHMLQDGHILSANKVVPLMVRIVSWRSFLAVHHPPALGEANGNPVITNTCVIGKSFLFFFKRKRSALTQERINDRYAVLHRPLAIAIM